MFLLVKIKCLPVIRDSSTIECPSITRPSTGNLPPGITLTMSPRWTSSTSTCSSLEQCFQWETVNWRYTQQKEFSLQPKRNPTGWHCWCTQKLPEERPSQRALRLFYHLIYIPVEKNPLIVFSTAWICNIPIKEIRAVLIFLLLNIYARQICQQISSYLLYSSRGWLHLSELSTLSTKKGTSEKAKDYTLKARYQGPR